jgi:hypothetical protein
LAEGENGPAGEVHEDTSSKAALGVADRHVRRVVVVSLRKPPTE